MEISFSSNSITDDHITTKFGTSHDSPAVVQCAKYCGDHFISIWMRAKWNFHHIWIVMEKLFVKWAPGQINCTKMYVPSFVVNGCCFTEEVNTEYFCAFILLLLKCMTLFKKIVLKGSVCVPFLIEWLEIQAALIQAIQGMVYITKTSQNYY